MCVEGVEGVCEVVAGEGGTKVVAEYRESKDSRCFEEGCARGVLFGGCVVE